MKWLLSLIVGTCLYIPTLCYSQIIQHNISDDGYARVPLQFAFPFYGQVFTESYMFSNGVVGFLSPQNSWCCSGFDLRTNNGTPFNFAIMPLQTDLLNYGQGRFLTEGTPQYQRYGWENISEYGVPGNLNTFGVEIRPSGYIGINYEKVNISPWRTVTQGITGDTSQGQYTQYYHGPGFSSTENVAYITQVTGNLCLTDPLSSPSCPGYQQAYAVQQCAINPLYNPSCPGYAEAYYAQQCTLNSLYDVNCPGYGVAYLTQQCSLSALYNASCPGYTEAYFAQQCNANQLYSRECPGYSQAYALANVIPATSTSNTTVVSVPQLQVSTSGTVSVEAPVIADPVVNEVVTRASPTTSVTSVTNTARTTESVATSSNTTASAEEKKDTKSSSSSTKQQAKRTVPKATSSKDSSASATTAATAPVLVDRNIQLQQLQIIDMLYLKMVKKPIQDNGRGYYNLIMNSQHKHEEMVDGQYRK